MGLLRKVTGKTVARNGAPVKQMQKRFNRAGQGAKKDIFAY